MPIILPKKSFKVFGKTVEFSSEELLKYKNDGLEIPDGSILEFFLMSNGTESFSDSTSSQAAHDKCIEAIEHFAKVCESGAKVSFNNPEAWTPI